MEILLNICFHQSLRCCWPAKVRSCKTFVVVSCFHMRGQNSEDSCLKTQKDRPLQLVSITASSGKKVLKRVWYAETGHTGSWKAKEASYELEKGNKLKDIDRSIQQTREMLSAAGLWTHGRENIFNTSAEISSNGQDNKKLGNGVCWASRNMILMQLK